MDTVYYTHNSESLGSSLVDGVYYHEGTRRLVVDLNDQIYAYTGVPKSVYDEFVTATSAGRYYAQRVKPAFGPGEYLGYYDSIDFVKTGQNTSVAATTLGTNTVGTPKNLTYAANAVVTNVANTAGGSSGSYSVMPTSGYTTLATATNANTSKYDVTFEVNGQTKTHTLRATSVDEAVSEVQRIAQMLDLTFNVRSVTVYFE